MDHVTLSDLLKSLYDGAINNKDIIYHADIYINNKLYGKDIKYLEDEVLNMKVLKWSLDTEDETWILWIEACDEPS